MAASFPPPPAPSAAPARRDWFAINEDVDSEFCFWKEELAASARLAAIFAVVCGVLMALVPGNGEGARFVHAYWPSLVECAFWLGLFVGLLWGAAKRCGAALAGNLPWEDLSGAREPEATGRSFGQWSVFSALAGCFLWLTHAVALAAQSDGQTPSESGIAALTAGLSPLWSTCFAAAVAFALVALTLRWRRQRRSGRAA